MFGFTLCAKAQNLTVCDDVAKMSVQETASVENYKNLCSQKVQENWKKSNIKHDDTVIKITFKTLPDGSVQDMEVEIPSKFEQNNQAAINAILSAAPFEKFSADLNAEYAQHTMFFPCRRYAQITPLKKN